MCFLLLKPMFKWLIHNVILHILLTVVSSVFGFGFVPQSLQWAHIMSHHAKCFDAATQRARPIWCQSPQVLKSPRWGLSEGARTKSPPQQPCTMQPDWQQKGQNGASLSSGCLSGVRKRKKDSEAGACIGSTERIGRKQDAFCLKVTQLTAKQRETFNFYIAFSRTEQLCGIPWYNQTMARAKREHLSLPFTAW